MPRFDFPSGGLSDDGPAADQPAGTTREAVNVRSIDPKTGRSRGAQRSGLSEDADGDNAGTAVKISEAVQVAHDLNLVDYSDVVFAGATAAEWEKETSSKEECRNVETDVLANVFALDGKAGIVKYTAEGEVDWEMTVPVDDDEHKLLPLVIDDAAGIFTAVESGGDQDTAAIFYIEQVPQPREEEKNSCRKGKAERTTVVWTETTGKYVTQMVLHNGLLYTLQEDVGANSAEMVAYDGVYTATPFVSFRREVPYPANDIALNMGGDFFVASGPNVNRGQDPKAKAFTARQIAWTPKDLKNYKRRVWAWYRAEDLQREEIDLEDGENVTFWPDISGNNRHLFEGGEAGTAPPIFRERGIGGLPSVQFTPDTVGAGTPGGSEGDQYLTSVPNWKIEQEYAEEQLTTLPAYQGDDSQDEPTAAGFTVLVVYRTKNNDASSPATLPQCVFSQSSGSVSSGGAGGASTSTAMGLFAHRAGLHNNYVNAGVGECSWYERMGLVGVGGVVGDSPDGRDYLTGNDTAACIALVCHNGGQGGDSGIAASRNHTNATPPANGEAMSAFRVNGFQVDQWHSRNDNAIGTGVTEVGRSIEGSNHYLDGDIAEIIVLRDTDELPDDVGLLRDNGGGWDTLNITRESHEAGLNFQANNPNGNGRTEAQLLEGYAAHKYGLSHLLPPSSATAGNPGVAYHFYFSPVVFGPPKRDESGEYGGGENFGDLAVEMYLNQPYGMLAKFAKNTGKPVWVATSRDEGFATQSDGVAVGGVGFGVEVSCDGDLFSMGPNVSGVLDNAPTVIADLFEARKLIDEGDTVTITGGATWTYALPGTDAWVNERPRADVDEFDNFVMPHYSDAAARATSILILKGLDGSTEADIFMEDDRQAFAVRVDPRLNDYKADAATVTRHEFVFTGTTKESAGAGESVASMRLVDAVPNANDGREMIQLGVNAGDIQSWDATGWSAVTGGAGALDSTSRWIDSTVLFGKVYFTDGIGYKVYQRDDDDAEEIITWKAKHGTLPKRARQLETWRERIVAFGTSDAPHNWYMSAKGRPDDWDYFPPDANDPTKAISGVLNITDTTGPAIPDRINAFIPYSDDIAFIGGDRSIWRFAGDPAAGGELELVSDTIGIAFGKSWAKDPEGRVYFFGSRGGVFVMSPDGGLVRLSKHRIERRLQDVDLSTHFMRLVWDYEDEGLHVFQIPYDQPQMGVTHWFWCEKTDSWFEDTFFFLSTTVNHQPTAVVVLDGDSPDDRRMVIGCGDGRVRTWDKDARNDAGGTGLDDIAIASKVAIGPVGDPDGDKQVRWSRFTPVLATDQEGLQWEILVSDEADADLSQLTPTQNGLMKPGRNGTIPVRARGAFVWLRLFDASLGRWAWERGTIKGTPAGRVRR